MVYAMRVTEALSFQEYDADPRFQDKKPYRWGSRKQSCGDNIYFYDVRNGGWGQRDSFHSKVDGSPQPQHIARDTGVNRVLISSDFVYFGGFGPTFPEDLRQFQWQDVCKTGRGRSCFDNPALIAHFVHWVRSLDATGYQAAPFEWKTLRG
jgi:hypothetical protein